MRITFVALALAFAAFGCGSNDSRNYTFSEGSCSTNTHNFDSQAAYCQGLESTSLNNGCALDMREAAFARDCGGSFAQTN
jgi:hypothetical protein